MRILWIAVIAVVMGFAACGTADNIGPPTITPPRPSLCTGANTCARACCHLVVDCKFGLTIDGVELSEEGCTEACNASDPIWDCFGRAQCTATSLGACATAADAGGTYGFVPDGGNPPRRDAGTVGADAGEPDGGTSAGDADAGAADAG